MNLIKKTDRLPFIFNDFFTSDWFGETTTTNKIGINIPAVNIKETDDHFFLEIAVPGLGKDDVAIELDNDLLTISSKINSEENEVRYTRKEFNYQSFQRSFTLPDSVNGNAINASYENGVLLVTIPKKEEAKVLPKRSIAIQ